jgi:hypothetical protein
MFDNDVTNSDHIALSEWMMTINKWQAWHNLRSHLGIFLFGSREGEEGRDVRSLRA